MPKKKVAKPQLKRQKTNKTTAMIQKMEQGFLQAPAKLASIVNKEINKLAKVGNKYNKVLTKLSASLKKSETRLKASNKTANTAQLKKKLKADQKAHQLNQATFADTNARLAANSESLTSLTKQYEKLAALDKQLIQFDKEWAKSGKKPKTLAKKVKATQSKAQAQNKNATIAETQNNVNDLFDTEQMTEKSIA